MLRGSCSSAVSTYDRPSKRQASNAPSLSSATLTTAWPSRGENRRSRRPSGSFEVLRGRPSVSKIPRGSVERLLRDLWPDVDVFRELGSPDKTFTDHQSAEALREAARSPGMPRPMAETTDRWAEAQPGDRPKRVTVATRLKGWRSALEIAGLPSHPANRPPGDFDEDACVLAVAGCWLAIGRHPSMPEYRRWHDTQSGVPGPDMIRARLGGWRPALVAAYPLVHGKVPPIVEGAPNPEPDTEPSPRPAVGRAFKTRDVTSFRATDELFAVDPQVVERGVRSHFDMEAAVAETARRRGRSPFAYVSGPSLRPCLARRRGASRSRDKVSNSSEPRRAVAARNWAGPRYGEELRAAVQEVRCVLIAELNPPEIWTQIGNRAGVRIVGFRGFEAALWPDGPHPDQDTTIGVRHERGSRPERP